METYARIVLKLVVDSVGLDSFVKLARATSMSQGPKPPLIRNLTSKPIPSSAGLKPLNQ